MMHHVLQDTARHKSGSAQVHMQHRAAFLLTGGHLGKHMCHYEDLILSAAQ